MGGESLTEREPVVRMQDTGIDPTTLGVESDIMNSPNPRARRSPSSDAEFRRLWGKLFMQRTAL